MDSMAKPDAFQGRGHSPEHSDVSEQQVEEAAAKIRALKAKPASQIEVRQAVIDYAAIRVAFLKASHAAEEKVRAAEAALAQHLAIPVPLEPQPTSLVPSAREDTEPEPPSQEEAEATAREADLMTVFFEGLARVDDLDIIPAAPDPVFPRSLESFTDEELEAELVKRRQLNPRPEPTLTEEKAASTGDLGAKTPAEGASAEGATAEVEEMGAPPPPPPDLPPVIVHTPVVPRKVIHLDRHDVIAHGESKFWGNVKTIPVDETVLPLFQKKTAAPPPPPSSNKKKDETIQFLNPKEAMSFEVLMRGLASKLADATQIGKGLLAMDPELIAEIPLRRLQDMLVVKGEPNPGIKKLKEALDRIAKEEAKTQAEKKEGEDDEAKKGPRLTPLGLMFKSVGDIPNLPERLEACLFMTSFEPQFRDFSSRFQLYQVTVSNLTMVAWERGEPGPLLRALALERDYGNRLNDDQMHGLRIRALKKLNTVKANEPGVTFLSLVVSKMTPEHRECLLDFLKPCLELKQSPPTFVEQYEGMKRKLEALKAQVLKRTNTSVFGNKGTDSNSNSSSSKKSSYNKKDDRFEEVWDKWTLTANALLDGISNDIVHWPETVSDFLSAYGEPEEGNSNEVLSAVIEDLASFYLELKQSTPMKKIDKPVAADSAKGPDPQPPVKAQPVSHWELKLDDIVEKNFDPPAEALVHRFAPLRNVRNSWLLAKEEFLDPGYGEQNGQRYNGAQACLSALRSLYDMEHPRWNKVKDLVQIGLIKATKDCGNTSVSMGLASYYLAQPSAAPLVAFLNGGTDGLKLQFYAKINDQVVALHEVKNKVLRLSLTEMATFKVKSKTDKPLNLAKTKELLAREMKEAPWNDADTMKKFMAKFDQEFKKVDVFAFVTGTIRNHWEEHTADRAEMDARMAELLDKYDCRPWGACVGEQTSYFIPQSREGEFEFKGCVAIYSQVDRALKKPDSKFPADVVASMGIGAGSCQWVTRSSQEPNAKLHTISLEQGMKQRNLPHALSAKIVSTYEDPRTAYLFEDFLAVIEESQRPIIALKSGCLILLTETKIGKNVFKPNDNPFINRLCAPVSDHLEQIRVFYQHKKDYQGTAPKVASVLSIESSLLGKWSSKIKSDNKSPLAKREYTPLESRIGADASKALGLEQFFCIQCYGRKGLPILENDCTIVVSTADAGWFELPPIESRSDWEVCEQVPKAKVAHQSPFLRQLTNFDLGTLTKTPTKKDTSA